MNVHPVCHPRQALPDPPTVRFRLAAWTRKVVLLSCRGVATRRGSPAWPRSRRLRDDKDTCAVGFQDYVEVAHSQRRIGDRECRRTYQGFTVYKAGSSLSHFGVSYSKAGIIRAAVSRNPGCGLCHIRNRHASNTTARWE